MSDLNKLKAESDDLLELVTVQLPNRLRTPIRRLYCHVEEEYNLINIQTLTEKHQTRLVRDHSFKELNRYCDVLPFRENIVTLDECETVHVENYINANFISHPFKLAEKTFIACQAPLKNTMESFCRMILKYNVKNLITIINKQEESHRYFDYWGASQVHGNYCIEVLAVVEQNSLFRSSTLEFSEKKSAKKLEVTHSHIIDWKDYGVLKKSQLVDFVAFIKRLLAGKTEKDAPIVVHCSAGIGRTLTFICSYYLVEQNLPLNENEETAKHTVRDLVEGFREQRYNAINTLKQYKFLYEIVHFLQEDLD